MQHHREISSSVAFERSVRHSILHWYKHHARHFFWREQHGKNPTPPDAYIVMVSEIMLQQTQTSRVQEKLPLFLATFPTLKALANADNATVIKAWEGMGYNSRALRLRDCAKAIVNNHKSVIPSSVEDLLALPGIGSYTASAIAAFAYHQDVTVLDVNIRRVYSRLLRPMPTTISIAEENEIQQFAERIYPRGNASCWHQAVMDIGALFCTARAPKCSACPLAVLCPSTGNMEEVKKSKRPEPSWNGIPNRIWRGRVVQILRELEDEAGITLAELYERLFQQQNNTEPLFINTDKHNSEGAWLLNLVQGLERDEIVEIQQQQGIEKVSWRDLSHCILRLYKG